MTWVFLEEDFKHYAMNYIGCEPETEEYKKFYDAYLAGVCTCLMTMTKGRNENAKSVLKTVSEYMRRRSRDAGAIVAKLKLELESTGYGFSSVQKFANRMLHPDLFMDTFNELKSKGFENREAFMATLLALNLRSVLEM